MSTRSKSKVVKVDKVKKARAKRGGNGCGALSSEPRSKYAYVWLLMKGDSYLPGIYVSIYSVLRTNPDADLVVMVTDDVSPGTIDILKIVCTHVCVVPYIEYLSNVLQSSNKEQMYARWKNVAYTKWNMLTLPYEKVLFIDGDTIVTNNLDHLFLMNTPAGVFNNPYIKPYGYIPDYRRLDRANRDAYGFAKHGSIVRPEEVSDMLNKGGMLFIASCVLLSPSMDDYKGYISMLDTCTKVRGLPYGHERCHSMVDEQSLGEYYALVKGVPWYNIHQAYNYVGWKKGFLPEGQLPYILHYINTTKPWVQRWDEYPDVITWYKMADQAIKRTGISPLHLKLDENNLLRAVQSPDMFIAGFHSFATNILDIYRLSKREK